jgi:diguanylate cyclase (GGDEF)-like protein
MSVTDRLTGLPNYAYISDALPREVRRAERYGAAVSLVLLDLDHFKAFNDEHGHDAGNRMLEAVGRVMRSIARGSDIAGRFGGEEFVLIVPGPAEEAAEAADRFRRAMREVRVDVPGGRLAGVTVSAGVAEHIAGTPHDDLVRRADIALYVAKDAGRDRVVVDPASQDALVSRRRARRAA